jgi:uncharacterized protein (TIGR00730 family)
MSAHPLDSPGPAASPDTGGPVRSLLVFCGSRAGHNAAHAVLADAVGRLLAARSVRLVYGGGALGLMGAVGRATLSAGGVAEGVIPRFLRDWEVAEPLCEDMTITDSLHTRKAVMFERADAVLALPGGLGTLDELVEILSWRNLRLHGRPVWLMGDDGYWQPFLALLRHMVAEGFSHPDSLDHLEALPDIGALAARLPAP